MIMEPELLEAVNKALEDCFGGIITSFIEFYYFTFYAL